MDNFRDGIYLERISFARKLPKCHPPVNLAGVPNAGDVVCLVIYMILIFHWMLAVPAGILPVVPLNSTPAWILFAIGLIAIAARRYTRRRRRVRRLADLPRYPDTSCRLQVIGKPEDVCIYGSLDDVPFEPLHFLASFSAPRSGRIVRLQWIFAILVFVIGFAIDLSVRRAAGSGNTLLVAICAWSASVLAAAIFQPIYYRLTPGRLEVLTFSGFRRNPISIRSFDLTSMNIIVNMYDRFVCLRDDDGTEYDISLEFLPRRRLFASMLLLGALSSHVTNTPISDSVK